MDFCMKHTLKTLTLTIALLVGSVSVSNAQDYYQDELEYLNGKNIICELLEKPEFPSAGIYGFRFGENLVAGDYIRTTSDDEVIVDNFNLLSITSITNDLITWGAGWTLNRKTLRASFEFPNVKSFDEYQCKFMSSIDTYNREMDGYRLKQYKKVQEKLSKDRIYNNCIIDKLPSDANTVLQNAVKDSCKDIANDPSIFEKMKYD